MGAGRDVRPGGHHAAIRAARGRQRPAQPAAAASGGAGAAGRWPPPSWQPRLAHLPRPFVTVLVGGSSGPYVFDAAAAERLGREASALARGLGGSVLVTTSARTPIAAVDALFAAIDAPACLHRWAPGDSQNPYFGFIALADRIVVTADSISMIAEACATGRPVQMFDFGARRAADARGGRCGSRGPAVAGRAPARLALCRLLASAARPVEPVAGPAGRASGAARHRPGELARRPAALGQPADGRRRDDADAEPSARSTATSPAGATAPPSAGRSTAPSWPQLPPSTADAQPVAAGAVASRGCAGEMRGGTVGPPRTAPGAGGWNGGAAGLHRA